MAGIPEQLARTRVLIISDTHNAKPQFLAKHAFRAPLPKADVLIHAGDLTVKGRASEYETTLETLRQFDAELKLVIAGNHDVSLDRNYKGPWGRNGQDVEAERNEAEALLKGPPAVGRGITYLDEGLHTFSLRNGSKFSVYASPYTPEFCDWAFDYKRSHDRWNAKDQCHENAVCIASNPIPDFPKVDIMITHGPPARHRGRTSTGKDAGCPHLFRALQRVKPRLHCFGHIHEAWGAEHILWSQGGLSSENKTPVQVNRKDAVLNRGAYLDISSTSETPHTFGQNSLLVNAAIMDLDYRPTHAPWIIDMDLPVPAHEK